MLTDVWCVECLCSNKVMSHDTATRYHQLTTTLNSTTPYLRLTSLKYPLIDNNIKNLETCNETIQL